MATGCVLSIPEYPWFWQLKPESWRSGTELSGTEINLPSFFVVFFHFFSFHLHVMLYEQNAFLSIQALYFHSVSLFDSLSESLSSTHNLKIDKKLCLYQAHFSYLAKFLCLIVIYWWSSCSEETYPVLNCVELNCDKFNCVKKYRMVLWIFHPSFAEPFGKEVRYTTRYQ